MRTMSTMSLSNRFSSFNTITLDIMITTTSKEVLYEKVYFIVIYYPKSRGNHYYNQSPTNNFIF